MKNETKIEGKTSHIITAIGSVPNGIHTATVTMSELSSFADRPKITKAGDDIEKMIDLLLEKQKEISVLEMTAADDDKKKWKEIAIHAAKGQLNGMRNKLIKLYSIHMGIF